MSTRTSTHAPLPVALTVRDDPAEIAALWAMTPQERIDAMWAGQLTLSQLTEWSGRRPSQVPRLGGELAYLVIHTPEWAEPAEQRRDNVVHLPERSERRAAA
ncbi:MAG: hypothetical protein ACRDL5_18770 [Solirubrobacteraceae bacterium]